MASGGILQTPTRRSAERWGGRMLFSSSTLANCGGKFLPWAELSSAVPLRRWLGNRLHVSSSHSFGLYHKSTLEISIGHSLAGPVSNILKDT